MSPASPEQAKSELLMSDAFPPTSPNACEFDLPDFERFNDFFHELSGAAQQTDTSIADEWPEKQLGVCARRGIFKWFFNSECGGFGWSDADIASGYVHLAKACLTTAFVITQRQAACSRLVASSNQNLKDRYVPGLVSGATFATVGISHLSTSRRHLAKPVLTYSRHNDQYIIQGYSPWITGAEFADLLVVGATRSDGTQQMLFAVPTDLPGVVVEPRLNLVALSASYTAAVHFNAVVVPETQVVAGPMDNVMRFGGSGTGGLQTSALAIGHAKASIHYLDKESQQRSELRSIAEAFENECRLLTHDLKSLASGTTACTAEDLRVRANSLTLRTSQAALGTAKGAGFIQGHPVGRWCREALFFLVWSCPAPVALTNLCELAGIDPGFSTPHA